jgi:hypothetical protein
MSKITIDNIIHWEKLPSHYVGIMPFTATIHHFGLSPHDQAIISDALVNAAAKMRKSGTENFYDK